MFQAISRFRKAPRGVVITLGCAVGAAVAGAAAASVGRYGFALVAFILMQLILVIVLLQTRQRLCATLEVQHRESMRYAYKADHRLRGLDSKLDWTSRTVSARLTELSKDFEAANRRVLAGIETERYAAAERHHKILASIPGRTEPTGQDRD